jgi:hypothetical protein
MKKRIKHFSPQKEESSPAPAEEKQDDFYLKLLITDLKQEAREMPRYSMWTEMVNKMLKVE